MAVEEGSEVGRTCSMRPMPSLFAEPSRPREMGILDVFEGEYWVCMCCIGVEGELSCKVGLASFHFGRMVFLWRT